MAEKRMPAAERQRETMACCPPSSGTGSWITGRIPDVVPGLKRS